MRKILLFIMVFFISSTVFGSTFSRKDYTCPICSENFKYGIQMSYSISGKNLDLKPFGAATIPTPIPKCPKCGFVFDNDYFTENEMNILKVYLSENNVNNKEKNLPNYYYLAEEMIIVNRSYDDVAWILLNSIWENKQKEHYEMLANKTIHYFDKVNKDSKIYNSLQLIKVDLLRRLGKMSDAMMLIEDIRKMNEFYKDYIIKVIDYQIELIRRDDREEHKLP